MKSFKEIYKKMNISNNFIFILFIVALILSVALLTKTIVSENNCEDVSSPKLCELHTIDKVKLISSDGNVENVKLPIKKDSHHSYTYDFIVKEDVHYTEQCINVNIYYATFIIRHGDEIIYEQESLDDMELSHMKASFNIIDVPKNLIGEKLEIEFKSSVSNIGNIMIPSILIGTRNQILSYYFYKDLINILSAIILFITAIFISVVGIFFMKIGKTSKNLFIVVLFSIIMSLYSIFQSWLVIYYIGDSSIVYFIKYTALILTPLPLFLLFLNIFHENDYNDWRVKSFELFIIAIFINLIVQWSLTLTGVSEFLLMEKISLAILAISSIYIVISVLSLNKNRLKNKKYLVISILPLLFLVIVAIVVYYKTYDVPMLSLIILSVAFFMIVHFILAMKRYVFEYNLAIEDDFYSQLAYFDNLTKLSNRNHFEEDIKNIINKEVVFNNIYLIMLDVNNFKKINDNYGHKVGDEYLKAAGRILNNIENKYEELKIYRYGGDEFIVLAYNKNKIQIDDIINDINCSSTQKIIPECGYGLEFAIGYSVCTDQRVFDIDAIKEEADKNMYNDKILKKEAKQ